MNIVDHPATASVGKGRATRRMRPILSVLLLCIACGAGGCADYYGAYPAYGPGYGAGYSGYGPATGTATPAMATQAPSQWRLVIGHIIRVALVITSAVPIIFGGRDIGYGGMVVRVGFTV